MKKIVLGILAILLLVICLFCVATCHADHVAKEQVLKAQQETLFQEEINDVMIPEEWYTADGYDDITVWWNDLVEMRTQNATIASDTVSQWGEYLTDEQKVKIQEFADIIQSSHSIREINECIWNIESLEAEAREAKEETEKVAAQQATVTQASYSGSASNFKSAGVIYYNGYRFTYYSSRVLYHYMTPQWTLGSDGIYRDSNGYIIIASSDHSQGTLLDTPFGTGIVRDSGCASGTIDVYVGW